jgi:DNA-binding MarR family transcriptional regulator
MLINKLSIIVRNSKIFSTRSLQEYGLGHPEQMILMFLFQNNNVNQDTIAKRFNIDKGTIAKTCRKLESKGYIERITNPSNQREKLINLCEKGREMFGIMKKVLDDWNNYIFEGLSEEDINKLNELVSKMEFNSIKVINKDGGMGNAGKE